MSSIIRSSLREEWLQRHKMEYVFVPELSLWEIDVSKSLENQARVEGALNAELVKTYAIAMKEGCGFPPITTYQVADGRRAGKHIAIDGNHRIEAAVQTSRESLSAYVVDIKDVRQIELLTRSANTLMGLPETRENVMEHAVYMVRRYGMSQIDAARHFSLHPGALSGRVRADAMREKLAVEYGVLSPAVSDAAAKAMGKIKDEAVFALFAPVVQYLTGHLVQEGTSLVNEQGSEAKRLAAAREFLDRPDVASRIQYKGRMPRGVPLATKTRRRLHSALSRAESILRDNSPTHLVTTLKEREELGQALSQLSVEGHRFLAEVDVALQEVGIGKL